MAIKTLHQVQVTISKDVATGEVSAQCQAIATLPEIEARASVSVCRWVVMVSLNSSTTPLQH